jgi:membrane protease subunit (stomatin/prohibitin family)
MAQQITSKKQLLAMFKEQLSTRPNQAIKALMFVYAKQTEVEKRAKETLDSNGVGFNIDAKFFSSLAEFYKSRGFLTEKQMGVLMKKISKYANQIMNHALETGKIRKEGKYYVW